MRAVIVVIVLCGAAPACAEQPTIKQLLTAEAKADLACRGASDPSQSTEECSRRDRLFGRLSQAGWCFGRVGQIEVAKEWHQCGTNSIRQSDLRP